MADFGSTSEPKIMGIVRKDNTKNFMMEVAEI